MTDKTTTPGSTPEMDHVREQIATMIAAGYDDHEAVLEYAVDVAESEGLDMDAADLRGLVLEGVRSHAALEATWTAPTDNDRLTAAFTMLEGIGIVSRENFTCCQTCGSSEIWEEMDGARPGGAPVRGYAFFHQQDAESGTQGEGVMLAFGSNSERYDADAAEKVARDIVRTLREHRLETSWKGDAGARIHVQLDWRRRRGTLDAGVLAA